MTAKGPQASHSTTLSLSFLLWKMGRSYLTHFLPLGSPYNLIPSSTLYMPFWALLTHRDHPWDPTSLSIQPLTCGPEDESMGSAHGGLAFSPGSPALPGSPLCHTQWYWGWHFPFLFHNFLFPLISTVIRNQSERVSCSVMSNSLRPHGL